MPEPPPGAEAVLAIAEGRDAAEAAVLRAGGRVDFVALADGSVRGSLATDARAWASRYAHPHEGAVFAGPDHDPTTLLAGLPAASVHGRTTAVVGQELREWSGVDQTHRVLFSDGRLLGARIAAHRGPGTPVWLALSDGRVARVAAGGPLVISDPLPWRITALAAAADGVLVGGEGDSWVLLRGEGLEDAARVPMRGETPPVTAITLTPDGRGAVVAHGLCYPYLATYSWSEGGAPRWGSTHHGKPPGAVSLAWAGPPANLYFGKSCGGIGVCLEAGGYHGAPLGGNPHHGLRLFEDGRLLLRGWDDGTLRAERVPEETGVWGKYPSRRR